MRPILILATITVLTASHLIFTAPPAFAGPGAGFVKMDLLPEFLDPYDLYFDFTFIRYMRPGEPLEIPRSRFNELYAGPAGKVPPKLKNIKITMGKKGSGEGEGAGGGDERAGGKNAGRAGDAGNAESGRWFSLFDAFYAGKTIYCDYDRAGRLAGALMLDASGEVCIRRANSFDAEGRLAGETSEVFDRVFGRDGSGSPDDRRPRTGETIFRRAVTHIYSPKGLLVRSEYRDLNQDGWFEHSYDPAGRLEATKCYLKELERLYYEMKYAYTGAGRLFGVRWHNGGTGALEMYYEYAYDEKGNCVSIKNPVFPQPDRADGKLEQKLEYDANGRLTRVVYYNWFRHDPALPPDSIINCSYGADGQLSEIEIEPAKLYPGKKYSIRYSYSFYED